MAGRQRSRTPRGVVSKGDETTDVVASARKFATFLHKQFLCNKAPAMTVQQTAALQLVHQGRHRKTSPGTS